MNRTRRPLSRLLVANRGEIAVRIARTARAMGIRTVAVYSDPDAGALHVAAMDEAVRLPGASPAETYLRVDRLLGAAARTGADAVHPGYGFLSENAGFANAVVDAGLTWVGPPPGAIAGMGDKVEAKRRMADAGVPVLPSVEDPAHADAVGYPLLVKAAAGGGGKGMRLVQRPEDLADAVAACRREAAAAFGDDRVFLERFVLGSRHIEVQVLADDHGGVVHVGERECSLQRRHQKVVEEAPSPLVDAALRAELGAAGIRAAAAIGYAGAGTVEFVADQDGRFAFLEVNTRLQVEHPVTELAWALRDGTPLDLVRCQLLVARGEPLPFAQDDLVLVGHAVEARVYAEDPAAGFLPSTGTLTVWDVPQRPGVRVDAGVRQGDVVGPHYDALLAKVVAVAPSRSEAAALLADALERSRIHGVRTNRSALAALLRTPAFLAGDLDTAFLDRHLPDVLQAADGAADGGSGAVGDDPRAVLAVAAALWQVDRRRSRALVPGVHPGWRNNRALPAEVAYVGDAGTPLRLRYSPADPPWAPSCDRWAVDVDGRAADVVVHGWPSSRSDGAIDVALDGRRAVVRVERVDAGGPHDPATLAVDAPHAADVLVEVPRFPAPVVAEAAGTLVAPMPGRVAGIAVVQGQDVAAGDLVAVLEAMKMEHRVVAPHAGSVAEVRVAEGAQVGAGDVLVVVEASADGS